MGALRVVAICLFAAWVSGCAASRAVAPLDKGEHGLTASFGGPFVEFAGAPVPVPLTQLGYRYGIDGKTNVHTALHLTPMVMSRTAGFDVGFARELMTADGPRPRLMLDLTTYWFFGDVADGGADGGFRFFPDLSLVATWDLPHRKRRRPYRIYLGVDNFMQPWPTFGWVLTPLFGAELPAHDRLGVQLEVQWNQPWADTTPLVPVWKGAGPYGAFAVKIGLNIYLPSSKAKKEDG